jgi:hypothetical protein
LSWVQLAPTRLRCRSFSQPLLLPTRQGGTRSAQHGPTRSRALRFSVLCAIRMQCWCGEHAIRCSHRHYTVEVASVTPFGRVVPHQAHVVRRHIPPAGAAFTLYHFVPMHPRASRARARQVSSIPHMPASTATATRRRVAAPATRRLLVVTFSAALTLLQFGNVVSALSSMPDFASRCIGASACSQQLQVAERFLQQVAANKVRSGVPLCAPPYGPARHSACLTLLEPGSWLAAATLNSLCPANNRTCCRASRRWMRQTCRAYVPPIATLVMLWQQLWGHGTAIRQTPRQVGRCGYDACV